MTRTHQNSLHLYFGQIAGQLNEHGIYQKALLDQLDYIDVPNTKGSIKEIWRCIQIAQVGKEHTADLTGKEVGLVDEPFNKVMSEVAKGQIHFPSAVTILQNSEAYE